MPEYVQWPWILDVCLLYYRFNKQNNKAMSSEPHLPQGLPKGSPERPRGKPHKKHLDSQKPIQSQRENPRNVDQVSSQQQLGQKQKLIEQNIKLKTQIFQLSKQLDSIIGKQQNRKKTYSIKQGQDDQVTKQKKQQLRKQQLQILSLKNKIHVIKSQLESVYNNRTLLAKEEQLKYLKTQLQNLQQQKKSLLKIRQDQSKVLKIIQNEQEYQQKIEELKKQLHAVKQQSKTLNQKLMQAQRILRKNHQQFISKQSRVKELEQKLMGWHNKAKKRKPIQVITCEMVQELEQQISRLQEQRKQTQKLWYEKVSCIDLELRQKKNQEERKLMLLKEKEKELKLNQLKIRELRKLIQCHMGAQGQGQGAGQDLDMHQFKFKRNIKYMKD